MRFDRAARILGYLLLPVGLVCFELALRFPDAVEHLYARELYPIVVRAFGFLNRASLSLAEIASVALALTLGLSLFRLWRSREPGRMRRALVLTWSAAGALVWAFLLLWGFNYARPPLEERMELSVSDVTPNDVLETGVETARLTQALFAELDPAHAPTRLPMSFDELVDAIDRGFDELGLPGDVSYRETTSAKGLWSSAVFSHLGVSGIFVPFTGEPSVNTLQPDVSLPIVVAHEKAHQRGITHEGEASFAAFLVCSRPSAPRYLRYAAYLYATRELLGEASRYLPREKIGVAWKSLGDGPRKDVEAIREFWRRYEGPATRVASQVNDRYLRALHVPGGIQSYGTVVRLLMALDAKGELLTVKQEGAPGGK